MQEQDGRCTVRVVRDRLGWLVEVVNQGNGGDSPRCAVGVMRHKRAQALMGQSSQDRPRAKSEYHSP